MSEDCFCCCWHCSLAFGPANKSCIASKTWNLFLRKESLAVRNFPPLLFTLPSKPSQKCSWIILVLEIFQLSAPEFNFFFNWTRLCKDTVRGIKLIKNSTFFTSVRVQYIVYITQPTVLTDRKPLVWKLTHPDADTCRCWHFHVATATISKDISHL